MQQATLDGQEANVRRRECEYVKGCVTPAVYELEVLIYGQGQENIPACESCASEEIEHTAEIRLDDLRRLKPAERFLEVADVGGDGQ